MNNNMIKTWLITASAPICGTDTYYRAYSEDNPELSEEWNNICNEIIEYLWENYSYLLCLEDEEYDSEEEEQEVYDQAYENWKCDCCIDVNETSEEDLQDIAPGGDINNIEIIYDERDNSVNS